jgi:hypothetical protein
MSIVTQFVFARVSCVKLRIESEIWYRPILMAIWPDGAIKKKGRPKGGPSNFSV